MQKNTITNEPTYRSTIKSAIYTYAWKCTCTKKIHYNISKITSIKLTPFKTIFSLYTPTILYSFPLLFHFLSLHTQFESLLSFSQQSSTINKYWRKKEKKNYSRIFILEQWCSNDITGTDIKRDILSKRVTLGRAFDDGNARESSIRRWRGEKMESRDGFTRETRFDSVQFDDLAFSLLVNAATDSNLPC